MDEAILGLDAEDAREAGARWSWQVQNGSGLIWVPSGRLNGLVWFTYVEAW